MCIPHVITFLALLSGFIVSAQLGYAPPVLDETHKAIDSKEIKCLGELSEYLSMPRTCRCIFIVSNRKMANNIPPFSSIQLF